MADGDFSPSNMAKLVMSLDDAMSDSRVQQRHNLMPKVDIIEQVYAVQTANWNSVRPNDRFCEEFDVVWLQENDEEAELITNQVMMHREKCAIDGDELGSAKKSYKLSKEIHIGVKIKDEDCGNIFDWEGKVSLSLLQAQKKLLERWAKALPALLDAGAGANRLLDSGLADFDWNIGAADGTGTSIQPGDITFDKSSYYLMMLFEMNKLQNPRIIDGGVFAYQAWLASIKNGTGAGDVGDYNAYGYIADRYAADFLNMYRGGYANNAFVIDQGSWAMPTVSFFPRLGENGNHIIGDEYKYSIPMAGFTLGGNPIYLDLQYKKEKEAIASSNGHCQLVHTFDLALKWDLWQAPKYTTDDVTGTVKITKAPAV